MSNVLIFFTFFAFLVSGCGFSTSNNDSLKATPIKLDVSGEKIRIDFEVKSSDSHEKNKLLVGISLLKDGSAVNVDLLRDTVPVLKVNVIDLKSTGQQPVKFYYFKGKDFSNRLATSENGFAVVYAEYYATYDYFLASIDRARDSTYRVEVEVVNGNPSLSNLKFEAFVDYRMYGGK